MSVLNNPMPFWSHFALLNGKKIVTNIFPYSHLFLLCAIEVYYSNFFSLLSFSIYFLYKY